MFVFVELFALAFLATKALSLPTDAPSNETMANPINLPYNRCVKEADWRPPEPEDLSELAIDCETALVKMEDMLATVGKKARTLWQLLIDPRRIIG